MIISRLHWRRAGIPGFTLIELMVTISIMLILLMVAVPSFNDATLGSKLSSYANNLAASAYFARSEAIKRNANITLCASSNGTSCASSGGWEQGWIVLSGTNVLQRQPPLPAGLKGNQTGGTGDLIFRSIGVGATQGTVTFCRASPVGSQERVVTFNATGGTLVKRTTSGICP